MKKKIIIGMSLFSLLFMVGGVYIIYTVQRATSKLDKLITLHEVEILRENLSIGVKRVQADLSLQNTHYARGAYITVKNVRSMSQAADTCFGCHHSEKVMQRLTDLKSHIEQYKVAISRVLTLRAGPERVKIAQENAVRIGDDLTRKIDEMIDFTRRRLSEKTKMGLRDIAGTKTILFVLVAVGPLLAIGLASVFIKGFTKPVDTILMAIRRLKGGNLDYRISGLSDEFGEVASAFNEMAGSLRENIYKIEDSEKRYRMLFENASDAIFILEAEGQHAGRIIAANRAAVEMHGYPVEELLTKNITDLDTPETAEGAPARIKSILEGERVKAELTHVRKDGSEIFVEVSAGLIDFGSHRYILAMDRDITERKQAEEALQRVEQMKVVGELAAGLAHEIKNPLAGIKVSIEVLLYELNLSEDDRDVLLRVTDEILRIELLMKELLNFARPPKPQFDIVDINRVLDKAMMFSVKNPSFASVEVLKDYDGRVPATMADPMQLQQVFMNLLLNAAEAMPGGGTLAMKTFYEEKICSVRITISDSGKGIDERVIDKMFQPFFTTKAKGTGLGLAITKRLVEQQGGSISVRNNRDGGAAFTITLPVKPVREEQLV
jgi:two-component system, NtrC family, sensor histidine kinase AtoS